MQSKQRSTLQEVLDRPWLAVVHLALGALWFYLLRINGVIPTWAELKRDFNKPSSTTLAIHSSVKEITHYSRGYPVVVLSNRDTLLLRMPSGAAQEYLQVGDSIAKAAKTDSITVYRRYPTYTEVRLYGNSADNSDYLDSYASGLLKRYRILNPPRP